jgi:hypothetical protein
MENLLRGFLPLKDKRFHTSFVPGLAVNAYREKQNGDIVSSSGKLFSSAHF